ncbi:hypothetical protein KKI93_22360, partial [Xenorhabdus bovienii]|nr:hypothetical protein [Xenorhabdus bovienii]
RHFTSTNAITIPHVFTLIIREKQRDEYVTVFCDNSLKLYGFVIEKRSDGQLICVPKYKRKDSNNVHYSSK